MSVPTRGPEHKGRHDTTDRDTRARGAASWTWVLAWLALFGLSIVDVAAQHVPSVLAPRSSQHAYAGQGTADLDPLRSELHLSGWMFRRAAGAAAQRTGGTLRVLVIPALFADSPEPLFSQQDIQENLFDGPALNGTLGELYDEMSLGELSVTGTVAPWFRSTLTLAEVRGGELNEGALPRTGEYLLEALAAADVALDLSQFDSDGPDNVPSSGDDNGFIDALFFVYHEVGLHCGGIGPWPHFGGLAPWNDGKPYASDDTQPTGEAIQANGYVLTTLADCAGMNMGAMPVAAHELGHVLGVPDFYHPVEGRLPTERKWVIGCWGLMAAGAWGCGASDEVSGNFGPAGMAPWAKDRLGWLNVEDVGRSAVYRDYVLEPVQASGHVLEVPLDDTGTESFMVEYRSQTGFDRVLPSSGVLIYRWHRDGRLWPHPDSAAHFYMFSLVEADANGTLQRTHPNGGNRGEPGDAWAHNGQAASFTNLDSHKPSHTSGLTSTVTFHEIRVEGGVAHIRLSTAVEAVAVGANALSQGTAREPYDARLPIGGGAPPYQIEQQPTLPLGISVAMVGGLELVLSGTPVSTGAFESEIGIIDALGRRAMTSFRLVVASLGLAVDQLLSPFLGNGASPPTPEDLEILDNDGNENGGYDVGDLRAQLVGR